MSDTLARYFNINVVKNDDLYSPLTQEGNVCGVGVNLTLNHDPPLYDTPCAGTAYRYINVIDSIEWNTPAEKAGLQPGDILLSVDGKDLFEGQQLFLPDDVADMIRGPEGSEVVIMVERDGRRLKFGLIREPLQTTRPSSPSPSSIMRKIMPVTPEALRSLELFEDRLFLR